jgi:enoyl-CoA hydratase/carnithine racemase
LRTKEKAETGYDRQPSDPTVTVELFAHGGHFTTGLDLAEVAPAIAAGESFYPEHGRDPWRLDGHWCKPIIAAAHRWVMTLGIELLLAADIRIAAADSRIAAADSRFAQIEVRRGIYPFGGATLRFPRETGWGNAMRWLLTGDEFDATEAHRTASSKPSRHTQPPARRPVFGGRRAGGLAPPDGRYRHL